MEYSHGSLASLPFTSTESHNTSRHLPLRAHSQTSLPSGQARGAMAIPGARVDTVPPPLPPPRYNHDLESGFDLAWKWQNRDLLVGRKTPIPIKPGSSLLGGTPNDQFTRDDDGDIDMEMDIDASHLVRPSARLTSLSHLATGKSLPSMTRRVPSPSGLNQGLHGENPLAEQNHKESTHAYDKHLLLKIGKAHTSSKTFHRTPKDSGDPYRRISVQTKGPSISIPTARRTSSSESIQRWMISPSSTVSPSSRSCWVENSMDPHDSASDNTPPSLVADPVVPRSSPPHNTHAGLLDRLQQHPEELNFQTEVSASGSKVSARRHDHASDEAGPHRSQEYERPIGVAVRGTKRRALSPLSRVKHTQTQEQPPSSLHGVRVGFHPTQSSIFQSPSLSSTFSSGRQSLSASNPISHPSSSMTSFSSLSYEASATSDSIQLSPLMMRSEAQEDFGSAGLDFQRGVGFDRSRQSSMSKSIKETTTNPLRVGNHFLCSCCPKKPRKFETIERLRAHENEKQYACAYCKNRFKNKNEAERHQNSLHLRRQSWSCSAISTYEAAFYPASTLNPRNVDHDVCGFCGEEFGRMPPNWDDRIDHLNNVHKFGECNASKKFYRADHFRQHLKHSHGSRNGKWTNILENSCLREEAPSESASLSPTASEHLQSGNVARLHASFPNPTDAYAGAMHVNSQADDDK